MKKNREIKGVYEKALYRVLKWGYPPHQFVRKKKLGKEYQPALSVGFHAVRESSAEGVGFETTCPWGGRDPATKRRRKHKKKTF